MKIPHCEHVIHSLTFCKRFTINYAFYKAGVTKSKTEFKTSEDLFFSVSNSNSFEQCILNWAYMFGSTSENHYWKSSLDGSQIDAFQTEIDRIFSGNWESHWQTLKFIRDKLISHFDYQEDYAIPALQPTFDLIVSYQSFLITKNSGCQIPRDLTCDLNILFEKQKGYAEIIFSKY